MTKSLLWGAAAILGLSAIGCGGSHGSGDGGTSIQPTTGSIVEYTTPTANSGPTGITTGSDKNIWVLEGSANKVAQVSVSGTINEFSLPSTTVAPSDIVSGSDGNLWYVDQSNHLGQVTVFGNVKTFPATFGGLTVGGDDNLWVGEGAGGNIDVYSTSGAKLHSFTSGTNPAALQIDKMTLGQNGDVWFDTATDENVVKMSTTGTSTAYTFSQIPSSNAMQGITKGPDGNIWFCAQNSNLIGRINSTSGALTTFAVPTASAEPYGITAGTDGNLWFTEMAGDKIGRITPSGVITEFPVPTANAEPLYITSGPDGNVWFTENGAGKVAKIHVF